MLPILLSILKIAGIVLLALLGLICLIVFTVLVTPVRYRLSGSYGGAVRAEAGITWFLRAVSVKVTYEKDLDISLRILGFRLSGDKKKGMSGEAGPGDGADGPQRASSGEGGISDGEPEAGSEPRDWDELEDGSGPEDWEKPEADSGDGPEPEGSFGVCPGGQPQDGGGGDTRGAGTWKAEKKKRPGGKRRSGKKRRSEEGNRPGEETSPGGMAGKLSSVLGQVKEKWNHLREQKEKVETFVRDEKNQQTFRLLLRQLKKIIRHLLPTKVRGKAVIGFEDPAATGKALSLLGVLYGWYGDSIEICPVFHEPVLEVEGSIKGRVRAGTILLCCLRILFNKNFRSLVRKFMKEWR